MQIKYTVKLTNPIKNFLKVQESFKRDGAFDITKKTGGLLIEGSFTDGHSTTVAYNYSHIGEDYLLTETDTLSLRTDGYKQADISDLFSTVGTSISEAPFLKVRNFFKLAKRVSTDSFKIDHYVEKSSDVFLVKINNTGLLSKLKGHVPPLSNTIQLSEQLEASDVIGYFLVSKPLKLTTNDYLYVSNTDLLKIPTGFCTIANKVLAKNSTSFYSENGVTSFSSQVPDDLAFSSPVLVDGVKVSRYSIKEYEKLLLAVSNDFEPLSFGNILDNITLIYEVLPDNSVSPYLAIVDKDVDVTATEDATPLLELQNADSEFLKKFVMKEYATKLTTTYNEYKLLNSDVLLQLTTTNEFEGKIIKL